MILHIAEREGFTTYRPRRGCNTKRFIRKLDNVSYYDIYEYPKTGPQEPKLQCSFDTLDEALEQLK